MIVPCMALGSAAGFVGGVISTDSGMSTNERIGYSVKLGSLGAVAGLITGVALSILSALFAPIYAVSAIAAVLVGAQLCIGIGFAGYSFSPYLENIRFSKDINN